DARWVYRAIRVAAPGGLGKSDRYDVAEEPEWTLLEAMRYARARDRIAGEYASGYAEVFEYAVPRWRRFHAQWGDEAWATTAVYLGLLARDSDSHVARKWGQAVAREVSAVAARLEQELSRLSHPERMAAELRDQDAAFKRAGINPGTTADLVVAALLAVGLEDLLDPVPRRVLCSES
ncbi:MAG: triphosphoribosyl-dephospho-CoA synthase, partial [Gammaproteobacteria bacterium]|nr:triphosphoribosyl-dephospho-CoA synthase [Gammaproteobacteria bacterium]